MRFPVMPPRATHCLRLATIGLPLPARPWPEPIIPLRMARSTAAFAPLKSFSRVKITEISNSCEELYLYTFLCIESFAPTAPPTMRLSNFKALSFDCYGTLIDWETGLLEALRPLRDRVGVSADEFLETYGEVELEVEQTFPTL